MQFLDCSKLSGHSSLAMTIPGLGLSPLSNWNIFYIAYRARNTGTLVYPPTGARSLLLHRVKGLVYGECVP